MMILLAARIAGNDGTVAAGFAAPLPLLAPPPPQAQAGSGTQAHTGPAGHAPVVLSAQPSSPRSPAGQAAPTADRAVRRVVRQDRFVTASLPLPDSWTEAVHATNSC